MNLFYETNTPILEIMSACEMVNALKSRVFKTQFYLTLLQIDHLVYECEALAIICQPPSINMIDCFVVNLCFFFTLVLGSNSFLDLLIISFNQMVSFLLRKLTVFW